MGDNRTLDYVERLAVITSLLNALGTNGGLRRTSLMKMLYLLQTVKRVPLGYRFKLYLYGPYTGQVENDVGIAEAWQILTQEYVEYPSGYYYNIRKGAKADEFLSEYQHLIEPYYEAIDWVATHFKNYTAAQMELIATLVWVDRSAQAHEVCLTLDDLVHRVHALKSRASEHEIRELARKLLDLQLLSAVQQDLVGT